MTNGDKDRFRDFRSSYSYFGDVPLWRVLALADMAARDVFPDGTFRDDDGFIWGTFNDDDCFIWGQFRRIYELREKEDPII